MNRSMSVTRSKSKQSDCQHDILLLESSSHALAAGYKRPTGTERLQAIEGTQTHGKLRAKVANLPAFLHRIAPPAQFPAPLVLPGDDLAYDPDYPAQRVVDCDRVRNQVTSQRRTLYVVEPPRATPKAAFVDSWKLPKAGKREVIPSPTASDLKDYLAAFYHGMKVKELPYSLKFDTWASEDDDDMQINDKGSGCIGLNTETECIRIRVRPCKDRNFTHQLNLNDLLDGALAILPGDAYALLMMIDHDMYEDEEDDFCCGRAYGGSRVSVVSSSRYHPHLDARQAVERDHAWPASHCAAYVDTMCVTAKATTNGKRAQSTDNTALRAAVAAHGSLRKLSRRGTSVTGLQGLWLGRVCRTASHEIGHCFGIDHCTYYACVMQGTATVCEDARQPPYLCPVDLAKVITATDVAVAKRYEALLAFCEKFASQVHLFAAFAAWLRVKLQDIHVHVEVIELDD